MCGWGIILIVCVYSVRDALEEDGRNSPMRLKAAGGIVGGIDRFHTHRRRDQKDRRVSSSLPWWERTVYDDGIFFYLYAPLFLLLLLPLAAAAASF